MKYIKQFIHFILLNIILRIIPQNSLANPMPSTQGIEIVNNDYHNKGKND
jgi:hypothetical protein